MARILAVACCLTPPIAWAGDVGGTPYYEYEAVAEVGSSKTGAAQLTQKPNPSQPGAAAINFWHAINDAGDVLFEATFRSDIDPSQSVVDTHRVIGRPGLGGLLDQVGKGTGIYQGTSGLALDGTVFSGNDIFVAGDLIRPAGSICEVILDSEGFAKPCRGILPFRGAVSRNGRIALIGFDTRRHAEQNPPWLGVHDVLGFGGGGSALQLRVPLAKGGTSDGLFLAEFAHLAVADNGRVVLGEFVDSDRRIAVVEPGGLVREVDRRPAVMGAMDFNLNPTLSLVPSITADGEFIAYARHEPGDGSDSIVIVQPVEGASFKQPTVVFSTTNVIGLRSDFRPIRFARIGMQPVSIIRHDVGEDGRIEGDTLWLLFAAQPDAPSRDNPHRPGVPLLFRNTVGIWALRVDIRRSLPGGERLVFNASGPIPVLQVGDTFRGRPIRALDISQSLARGTADRLGNVRTPTRCDHVAVVRVETDDGPALIRATHFDTDEDGLPDHWERPDGGIDADRDGGADLRLARFGADPRRKDLFLELDWLAPRTTGHPTGWRNEPHALALDLLVEMFAMAPVTNVTGELGITLHIDAGPRRDRDGRSYSRNFPEGQQGGDEVTVDGARPDILQIGSPDRATLGGLTVAPLDAVKDRYFGTADKNAREFAFRYAVLGDFFSLLGHVDATHGAPVTFTVAAVEGQKMRVAFAQPVSPANMRKVLNLRWVGFPDGPAAGEVRRIPPDGIAAITDANGNVTGIVIAIEGPMPRPEPVVGVHVILLNSGASALSEAFFRDVLGGAEALNGHRLPGNDIVVSMPSIQLPGLHPTLSATYLGRILSHEIGHTLGLAHGGNETACAHRGDVHWSVMSYTHLSRIEPQVPLVLGGGSCPDARTNLPAPPGLAPDALLPGVVDSYSNGSDPLGFNEWAYLRMDAWATPWNLGNSQMRYAAALPPVHTPDDPGPVELAADTLDRQPPRLSWLTPAGPIRVSTGSTFAFEFTASDNVALAQLRARLDANGDGSPMGPAEVVVPASLGGDRYRATFSLSGPDGPRAVVVEATDPAGNVTSLSPRILVGSGSFPDTTTPVVEAVTPREGDSLPSRGPVAIRLRAQDNETEDGLVRAWVEFDVDGNGSVDPASEVFPSVLAEALQPGTRVAMLPQSSGAAGVRTLRIVSEDAWLNRATREVGVRVTPPDTAPPTLVIESGPAEGSRMGYGPAQLRLRVQATDDSGIAELAWSLDANGDGILGGPGVFERQVLPVGGGASVIRDIDLYPTFRGPPGTRTIRIEAADMTGNRAVVSRSLELVDAGPPSLWLLNPEASDPVRLGGPLTVSGQARDDQGIARLTVSLDANGDGVVSPDEVLEATLLGADRFQATFPVVTGGPGTRRVLLRAVDPVGQAGLQEVPVEVTRGVVVHAPLANDPWRVGSTHLVSLEAPVPSTAAALPVFRARFDVDGDGVVAGLLEDQTAAAQPSQAGFVAARYARVALAFGSLSGPPGPRRLRVEIEGDPATAVERDVWVEAPGDPGRLSVHLGHVPFTAPLLQAIGDGDSVPTPVATVSNVVLFTALTRREGLELWRTDGTPGGTSLLKDIHPGVSEGLNARPQGSDPSGFVSFRGKVFFAATDQSGGFSTPTLGSGRELWATDGTPAGTQLVRDINPDRIPAQANDSSDPAGLVVFRDRIWFAATVRSTGRELWTSDGTGEGTVPFMDLVPGPFSSNPTRLTVADDLLYFIVDQRALWRTDGTVAGTRRVHPDEEPDFRTPGWDRLVALGNRLFALRVRAGFYELWTSDGTTEGTRVLKVLAPFSTRFGDPEMAVAGDRLVFSAESAFEGRELWVTDGTEDGTRLLRDFWPGGPDAFGRVPNGQPRGFTPAGSLAAFAALSPDVGGEPWVTDGTDAGTRLVGDVAPNAGDVASSTPTGSSPSAFVAGPGSLWFAATDGGRRLGNELRRWDGTRAPELVRDLTPIWVNRLLGSLGSFAGPASSHPTSLLPVGGRVFFRAMDPIYGAELHVSDGSAAGTRRLANLNTGAARPSLLLRKDGSRILVSGFDGRLAILREWTPTGGSRVWASPAGGAAEPRMEHGNGWAFVVTNGQAGALRRAILHEWRDSEAEPTSRLVALDVWRIASGAGFAWAAGVDTQNNPALWRIGADGDPVAFPIPGSNPTYTLFQSAELNGRLLFSASGQRPRELWSGGADGVRVLRAADGSGLDFIDRFHRFNDRLYFQAATQGTAQYWSTDGSDSGTRRFREEGPAAGRPVSELKPVTLNGKLLFSALRFGEPHELWISDGTTEGTTALGRVLDPIRGELHAQSIRHLAVAGDRAFFNGTTAWGAEPWVTDGTPGGTRMVANIARASGGSWMEPDSDPAWITPLGRNVVFVAGTAAEGRELWFSDGTEAGTRPVKNLVPGPSSPDIADLTPWGGRIFFTAKTTAEGRELWATDGTAEGTVLVEDLLRGPMSSDPSDLTVFGGRMAYLARDQGDDLALRSVAATASPYEAWLSGYVLPPGFPRDPAADADGDGASNALEFLYRTSPVDPRDKMGFTSVRSVPGVLPTLALTYLRPTDWLERRMNFQLQFTDNFNGWSALFPSRTTVEDLGAMERVTVEVQGELQMRSFFVRLRVTGL